MSSTIQTIREIVLDAEQRFERANLHFGHGTDNARDEAYWLVVRGLERPFDLPESALDEPLSAAELQHVQALVERRIAERIPAGYLLGEGWFCGLSFRIDENVLVPRSPIAELIEAEFAPWLEVDRVKSVADIGTGSGCIGIACALLFEQAKVDLGDVSSEALALARQNIALHGLDERVRALHSDIYAGLDGERYDLIVSNPPYVGKAEYDSLPDEYFAEPKLGLETGDNGLDIPLRILAGASQHLNDDGLLVVEVGNSMEALQERLPTVPLMWLEFAHGGSGVFALTAEQLREHDQLIQDAMT